MRHAAGLACETMVFMYASYWWYSYSIYGSYSWYLVKHVTQREHMITDLDVGARSGLQIFFLALIANS